MRPIVEVKNICKEFNIGSNNTPYLSLREVLSNPFKRLNKSSNVKYKALNDVSFEVMPGESIAIIGRNGAGKSTLLKILSKITPPTSGKIISRGRVASLLEVGTGFHPELSGRENIFMNGSVLGMSRSEINLHFDNIVDFSGINEFLDTPLKRYSSGMQLRLAFAVAAHLNPEILIVDEVLAVGDAEFQKKCIGKMKEVSNSEGRTILFVSHNMAAVRQLCNKGLVLKSGTVAYTGNSEEAISFYQNAHQTNSSYLNTGSLEEAIGNENIRILSFEVLSQIGDVINISSGIEFSIEFYNAKMNTNIDVTFELRTLDEIVVFHHGALVSTSKDSIKGVYKVKATLPPHFLNAGTYKFNLIFGENQRYPLFTISDIIQFEVVNESLGANNRILPGVVRPDIKYEILKLKYEK